MPIYEKPTHFFLKEMVTVFNLKGGQSFTKQQAIAWFQDHYPKIKVGTVAAHLIRLSTNAPSRVHYIPKQKEDDILYQIDSTHFRLYDSANDPTPIYNEAKLNSFDLRTGEERIENLDSTGQFAYEKDLQNFLAKNLNLIDSDLRLYKEESITGLEFPVGGRFIDILAVDKQGNYVVIELKVSKGYDRVVGQLLRYMAWIKKHHADSTQTVRGVIIAREISEDLILACSNIGDVSLYEYTLEVALQQVSKM